MGKTKANWLYLVIQNFPMQKVITLFTLAFSILAVQAQTTKNTGSNPNLGGGDDAQSRQKYEHQRLADPATGQIPLDVRARELAFAATLPSDFNVNSSGQKLSSIPMSLVNRGPWNVGGKTSAFAIDASNENRLLAGTTSGGMWLSTDGGASWTMTNTTAQLKGANCLAQDRRPNKQNTWYYGGGSPWASAGGGGNAYFLGDGIFKSLDSGLTWQQIPTTASGNPNNFTTGWQIVYSIAVDPSAPDSVDEFYAAVYGQVYKTMNGGANWTPIKAGGSYFTEVTVTTTGVVYATLSSDGTQKGIWRSPDGVTFTQIIPPNFPTTYNRIVMGINPNNENEIYFLANTPGFGKVTYDFMGDPHYNSLWKYTYVSGDGDSTGGSWQDLSINLPATGGIFDKFHTQESYDMVIKVKPGNSNVVFLGGTNLYRSTSAFQDSTSTTYIGGYLKGSALPVIASYANHHPDQHCIEFLPSNPDVLLNANDGGVFKTLSNMDSVVAWQSLNNGYVTTMFYTVAIDQATNSNIICGGAQDNGTWWTNTAAPTSPWLWVHGGDGAYCQIADSSSAYYFSIQNCKRIVKTQLDASGNTIAYRRIDPIGGKGYLWMNPFVLDPNNDNIMYLAGGKYLWRNDDLSAIPLTNQWDSISTNWVRWQDSVPTANSVITAVAVSKTPANRVYYGTNMKRVYRIDSATTGTPTPVDITPASGTILFPSAGYVSNIAVDPHDGNKVLVVFSNYNVYSLFYTTDGGTTWQRAGGNLEGNNITAPSVRWASILHVSDGTVYLVGTSTGLYATDTLMGTNTVWVQQGAGTIGNAVCDMIVTRESDGLVVVGTHANGMYSTNVTTINDIITFNEVKIIEDQLELKNFPNPLNASTTIEFNLKNDVKVNLHIWDEGGRLVETLISGATMNAGKHSVQFDRKNLRAGIYYYSLLAGDKRKTNMMVITGK